MSFVGGAEKQSYSAIHFFSTLLLCQRLPSPEAISVADVWCHCQHMKQCLIFYISIDQNILLWQMLKSEHRQIFWLKNRRRRMNWRRWLKNRRWWPCLQLGITIPPLLHRLCSDHHRTRFDDLHDAWPFCTHFTDGMRERDRDRQTERGRDRQTDRQRASQPARQTETESRAKGKQW